MTRYSSYIAEFIGTLLLVLIGCGSVVIAGPYIGYLGVALAFGFTLMTLTYMLGGVSGCHVNPAVTLALWLSGKFPKEKVTLYIASQILGGLVAGYILYVIASGDAGFALSKGFATNGFGTASPHNYSMMAGILTETLLTAFLLLVILFAASSRIPKDTAALAIGGAFVAMHLFAIPVTNASFNIARTLAVAVFEGGTALMQSWIFLVSHLFSVGIAVYAFKWIDSHSKK